MKLLQALPVLGMLTLGTSIVAEAEDVVLDEFIEIPPYKEEIVTERPSVDMVWVPGAWERDPGKWRWEKGRWVKPPHKWAHYRKGHWAWEAGKWHWREAHWTVGMSPWIVEEAIDVPPTLPERKPPQPSATNHWVAGHWDWDGSWFWVPGHWTSKPNPNATWVPGKWMPYGTSGHSWWMGGHWSIQ